MKTVIFAEIDPTKKYIAIGPIDNIAEVAKSLSRPTNIVLGIDVESNVSFEPIAFGAFLKQILPKEEFTTVDEYQAQLLENAKKQFNVTLDD